MDSTWTTDAILARLAKLRIDRSRGPAPHKPILLLALLDLAESGLLTDTHVSLSPELSFRFNCYGSLVAHRRTQSLDVRYPFFHLRSDGFWVPLASDGSEARDHRSASQARIEEAFLRIANSPDGRREARCTLIPSYFEPAEQVALLSMLKMPSDLEGMLQTKIKGSRREEAVLRGRDVRFRLDVVVAYAYTCALTGYRVSLVGTGTIVDAAHIHPFSRSRNDDPRNGLALCKNAHWLFDQGLWTLDEEYRVLVAQDQYSEECPDQKPLSDYRGRAIRLPSDRSIWPDPRHLSWHRSHVFLGSSH